jgi:hypothetical protein
MLFSNVYFNCRSLTPKFLEKGDRTFSTFHSNEEISFVFGLFTSMDWCCTLKFYKFKKISI